MNKTLTFRGDGADVVTVEAFNTSKHIFNVTADYVNISGFTATNATAYGNAGIYLGNGVDHCNISYNNISNNNYGVYLSSSSNNTLVDNTANSNEWYGIYLCRSNTNTLLNNAANSNKLYIGIYLSDSDDNRLIGNTADYNGWEGIRLEYSDNCTVKENNLFGNNLTDVATGLLSCASNNTVIANNVVNSNTYGIYLHEGCFNNTITNNIVSENDYTGIIVYNSSDATICDNTANNNDGHGIFMVDSPTENITIHNNTASHNTYHGIFGTPYSTAAGPMNLTIIGNTLIGNGVSDDLGYGIYLKESSGAIISKNHIANNMALNHAYGIKLYSFTDASIHNNTIVNSSDYGVLIDSSGAFSMINITDNRITNNIGGIRLNSSSGVVVTYNTISGNNIGINPTSSSDTAIYNNYFANTQNAYDDGTNIWNTTNTTVPNIVGGPFIGGNYWSDYGGDDADGDGFGDESYNIAGGLNQDHLPLVYASATCGDITGDGTIDTVDLLLLLEHVVKGTPVDACIGDIDGNGYTNSLDVLLLMGYINDSTGYSLNCPCGEV